MRFRLLFIFLIASRLSAQLSPGDLHQVHAELEGVKNCTQCHERGQQLAPQKCLKCHSLLRLQIEHDQGLHSYPEYRQCETCHIEHQGRNFNLIYWKGGMNSFDHNLTGYRLEGAHKDLDCRKCHNGKNITDPQTFLENKKDLNRTFLGLKQTCLNCHFDEHRAQLGEKCQNCHSIDAWKPAPKFDHDLTNYPLTGKHLSVECIKCHETSIDDQFVTDRDYQKFTNLKFNNCLDCHRDVHANRFGSNCQRCHNTSGWGNYVKEEFNHNLTRFPLKGKHTSVNCSSCHDNGKKLKFKDFNHCQDCHTDYHQGQFRLRKSKGDCQECHTVDGYSPALFTIEQHNTGSYALQGAHLAVPCFSCHKKINVGTIRETIQFQFHSTLCIACHSDPHSESVNKFMDLISDLTGKDGCEYCHSAKSWSDIAFNHAQTKFILEGKHKTTPCIKCHQKSSNGIDIVFNKAPNQCQDCHQDAHFGQFAIDKAGKEIPCQNCHTPNSWLAEKFDHNRDAKFQLTGAHQTVECQGCHKKEIEKNMQYVRYKPLNRDCNSCHGHKN